MQTGNENQAFLTKWINSHADACKRIGKPFVLEEFGKNVTSEAKVPSDWKKVRGPMFSHAYSEYISSLENGGNYQGVLPGSPVQNVIIDVLARIIQVHSQPGGQRLPGFCF